MSVLDKLFERNINEVEIGLSNIHLYSKEELEEAQIGYRVDNNGNPIRDWIGENYLVVGNDSAYGDPIIVDLSDEELTVYSMFHDDWKSLRKIANSFSQYINILNKIDKVDLSNEQEKNKLISNILEIIPKEGIEYWNSIIQVAYEFLNYIN